jgi:hypothetical protein
MGTPIRTTDITGRPTSVRHFIGITGTAFIIGIIATIDRGVKRDVGDFRSRRVKIPPVYFFGEAEMAGDGSANSFFKRS